MATQTKSRTRTASGARFNRTTKPGPAKPRFPSRTSAKKKQSSGIAAVFSALPISGSGTKKSSASRVSSSKAKPAAALLAAGVGALFGRKQLQKRKQAGPTAPPGTVS